MDYAKEAREILKTVTLEAFATFQVTGAAVWLSGRSHMTGTVVFDVRKISATEYSLGSTETQRRRYGTKAEIAEDIAFCLEFKALPARQGSKW